MAKSGIYISVDRRAFDGALQVSIGKQDEDGGGIGYRIAGPKYDGNGKNLIRHFLTERDRREIESYLALLSNHPLSTSNERSEA